MNVRRPTKGRKSHQDWVFQTRENDIKERTEQPKSRYHATSKEKSSSNKTKSLSKSHRYCSISYEGIGSLLIPRLKKIKLSTSGDHCLRQKKSYNKKATWLPEYINSTHNIIPAIYIPILESEIQKATSKFPNWTSPGIDRIQNFWWKKFSSLHKITAAILNNLMVEPNITPQWLTTGRTTLVAKKKETQDPSNYRPITCLPIIYKINTSVITSRITHHIETNNIIPPEQKGNSTNTFGTIDQLLINKMIQEDAE